MILDHIRTSNTRDRFIFEKNDLEPKSGQVKNNMVLYLSRGVPVSADHFTPLSRRPYFENL